MVSRSLLVEVPENDDEDDDKVGDQDKVNGITTHLIDVLGPII